VVGRAAGAAVKIALGLIIAVVGLFAALILDHDSIRPRARPAPAGCAFGWPGKPPHRPPLRDNESLVSRPVHSAVAFRVRHLGITWVNGTFGQWTADLNYDPSRPEAASVTAHIQTGQRHDRERPPRTNDLRQTTSLSTAFRDHVRQ